ncbi:MAG: M28 family peptidase [Gemmatimonadetes bacterium]|nr:M28 family peptidase [Gemmatimonadota bacterium]
MRTPPLRFRLLAVTVLLGCAPAAPASEEAPARTAPAPAARASAALAIDRDALLHHVQVLAADSMEGRALGTPGNARARRYLLEQFRSIGLEPFGGSFEQSFPVEGSGGSATGVNLVGRVEGSSGAGPVLVLTAHYDHLGVRDGRIFPGADDNASGTAALLVLAAWFAEHPPTHTMIFAALDGEEGGLRGARHFVEEPPVPIERIALNVNLDMVSHSDSLLFAAGTHHYPFLAPYVEEVAPVPPVVLRLGHDLPGTGSDDWTDASDHGPFHAAGIPFLYFGVEDHPVYHQPGDTYDSIVPGFFGPAVETIRRILVQLDRALPRIQAARGGA